jgi:hypothetical protein
MIENTHPTLALLTGIEKTDYSCQQIWSTDFAENLYAFLAC